MRFTARAFATFAACVSGIVTASAPSRAAETFQADPVHSSVVFRVKHMNTSYTWGRFGGIAGTFQLDAADPSKSLLKFEVKTASVDTGDASRDQHLKSPDFFNAVQFPVISFVSKTVAKSGNAYDVTGDLTLHGVTKSISLKVTPVGTGKDMKGTEIAGIEASFTISQNDFGINKMAKMIGDDVWVIVDVEGVRK